LDNFATMSYSICPRYAKVQDEMLMGPVWNGVITHQLSLHPNYSIHLEIDCKCTTKKKPYNPICYGTVKEPRKVGTVQCYVDCRIVEHIHKNEIPTKDIVSIKKITKD
jgi:hypothetical protein